MNYSVLCVLVVLTLLELHLEPVESQCCHALPGLRCRDGTRSTPCCGYRRCNLFCCACGGGCRRRGKRQVEDETEEAFDGGSEDEASVDPFSQYDTDQDGKISMNEATRWLIAGGCGNPFVKLMAVSSAFQNMDNDSDGGLDRNEIGG